MDLDDDIASPESTEATLDAIAPAMVASVAGLPALTVPVSFDADIPRSVQVIAGRFCDRVALGCGQAIEEVVGTLTPIDPRTAPPPW
jgi:amidase